MAPNLFKTAARPITSDQQRFFQQIPLAGCAGAALAIAFCQCLIYQASGCGGLGWGGGRWSAAPMQSRALLDEGREH